MPPPSARRQHRHRGKANAKKKAGPPPRLRVALAQAVTDPFETYALPRSLDAAHDVHLSFCTGPALGAARHAAVLRAVTRLRPLYEASTMGWHPGAKAAELRHSAHRYVFAECGSGRARDDPGAEGVKTPDAAAAAAQEEEEDDDDDEEEGLADAFVAFRWDVEDTRPIMYVYELHVAPRRRGNGLASQLMQVCERLCRAAGVDAIVLTVFAGNAAALSLYRGRLGYVTDASSPELHGRAAEGYFVLSKRIAVAPSA